MLQRQWDEIGVDQLRQGRRLRFERDVVVDELPEVGVGRRDAGVPSAGVAAFVEHSPAELDESVARRAALREQIVGILLELRKKKTKVSGDHRLRRGEA